MSESPIIVTQENFVEVETSRVFRRMARRPLNEFSHRRVATAVTQQNVVRMNRDTLYSGAIVDASQGFTVTLPDPKGRYMTAEIIDEGHYVHRVISEKGCHAISPQELDSGYVVILVRFFFDPANKSDLKEVHDLQNQLQIEANASRPYNPIAYDKASYKAIHKEATLLGETIHDSLGVAGSKHEVDPLRHRVVTAVAWGALPVDEAYYVMDAQPRKAIPHEIDLRGAPVDAFWSVSIYDETGFFRENADNSYSLNSVTTDPDEPIYLAANNEAGRKNYLHIFDGWNYVLRFYRPRPEILDGSWQPPEMLRMS